MKGENEEVLKLLYNKADAIITKIVNQRLHVKDFDGYSHSNCMEMESFLTEVMQDIDYVLDNELSD